MWRLCLLEWSLIPDSRHAYSLAHPISPLQCLLSVSPCLSPCALNLCAAHSAQLGGREGQSSCLWALLVSLRASHCANNVLTECHRPWPEGGVMESRFVPENGSPVSMKSVYSPLHNDLLMFVLQECASPAGLWAVNAEVWSVSMHFTLTGFSACSNSIVPKGEEMRDFYGCKYKCECILANINK